MARCLDGANPPPPVRNHSEPGHLSADWAVGVLQEGEGVAGEDGEGPHPRAGVQMKRTTFRSEP